MLLIIKYCHVTNIVMLKVVSWKVYRPLRILIAEETLVYIAWCQSRLVREVDHWTTRGTHRVKLEVCSSWKLSRWDLPVKAIGFFTRGDYNDITVCRLDSLLESRQ